MAAAPASLLARALDPRVEPPGDATSQRVLDAALELAAASGVRHLTMEDVARGAGVGRMTVYRRFGDKGRLVDALAAREAHRCLAVLDAAARPDQPIADQVAEGFVTSLALIREHPLLGRLARHEPEALLGALTAEGAAVFSLARAFLADRLRAAQAAGTLGDVEPEHAAEVLVRVMVSFALIGESVLPIDDDARAREAARHLLVPLLSG